MKRVIISGVGVEIPEATITNEELVDSYNLWADRANETRRKKGEALLPRSDADFIVKASGVKKRHVIDRDGILDPDRMAPRLASRADDAVSIQAEFGLASARKALDGAGLDGSKIDMVICAASHQQRPYPAMAIEIQKEIGASGAAFDMNLGCSSAGAALHVATSLVRSGAHERILVVTPEIITGHLNFRDRQTHFIFGDASASLVVEAMAPGERRPGRFEIVDTRNWTQFSNAIRTNLGYLSRTEQDDPYTLRLDDNLIRQVGNKVFKEVTVAGHRFIVDFLAGHGLTPHDVRRYWLHQANARMNAMILKLSFGHEVDADRAPMVLDRLANTAAAGAIVAFHDHHADMESGDLGLICAFGAGYSIGSALLRKL